MCHSALLQAGALFAAALPCTAANSAPAQTIYKCTLDGKVSYGDRPCDGAAQAATLAAPATAGASPSPVDAARERQRALASAGKQAETLARARRQREAQQDRADQQAARQAAIRRQRCEQLRLKHRWAEDDVRRATPATIGQARIKAARAADSLAVECSR